MMRKFLDTLRHPSVRLVLKLLLSAVILILLFTHIDIAEVWAVLRGIDPALALSALLVTSAFYILTAGQMRTILLYQGIPLRLAQVLSINLIAKFYSMIMPGSLAGGIIRWYHFSQHSCKRAQAAAAIGFNRVLDLATLCVLGLAGWSISGANQLDIMPTGLFVVVALIPPMVCFLVLNSTTFGLGERIALLPLTPDWVRTRLGKVLEAAHQFHRLGGLAIGKLVMLSALRHTTLIFAWYLLGRALDVDITLYVLAWMRVILDLVMMLPVSFSGLGVREASFVYLLKPVGVDSAAALALSLAVYSLGLSVALVGGMVEAARIWLPMNVKQYLLDSGRKG